MPETVPAAEAAPLLRMENVCKRFGGTQALNCASLNAYPAEVHALLGENGSGKSTLMKVLAGIHRADSGGISFDGRPIAVRSPREASDAGIAIVHQELNLVPVLSAAENLYLGQELRNRLGMIDRHRMRKSAQELFNQLEIDVNPATIVERLPVALRQMVEIARALTHKARLLILDEPTSALSEGEVQVLFRIVRRLRSEGVSLIYISHKMPEVFALADRYTILRDGKSVQAGLMAGSTETALVQAMVGRELGDYYPARATSPVAEAADAILQTENLSRPAAGGSGRTKFHNISFTLRRGEILGIAGLVGAGRTELFETLFGAAGSDWSGRIILEGKEIRPVTTAMSIQNGIALVTEDRGALGIFKLQSVLSNASIAELPRLATLGIVSSRRERAAFAREADAMRVKRSSDASAIDNLSGGNQQKVILARWLMTKPRVLLLDEPTRGIDVGAKSEIYKTLRQLCDAGVGILFISSELPEVLGLADRILVISAGEIAADLPAAGATEPQLLEAAMSRLNANTAAFA